MIAIINGKIITADCILEDHVLFVKVARQAKEMGFITTAGAPNILLGGSHSGNLCAHEAINEGVIDVICSDYYPAAMIHGVFEMHRTFGHPLHEMVKLITLNPAKAVQIDEHVGSIEVGKLADLVIIEFIEEDYPVVTRAIVDGKTVYQSHYR